MRVVLRADVDNLGHKGDIVDVADGFARNRLLPQGWAMKATKGAEAQAEAMRRARSVRDAADRAAAQEVATRLVPTTITVTARGGGSGRLFGSVTATDVAVAILEQTGIELERRKLALDEAIKSTGTHVVTAKLHPEVEFPVTVEVVAS